MNKEKNKVTKETGQKLWEYACGLYSNKAVEKACLHLQDNFSADVNVLLFICWLKENNYKLVPEKHFQMIVDVSTLWQRDVIEPLRQLRRQVASMEGAEAKQIKASMLKSELEAERSEQFALSELCSNFSQDENSVNDITGLISNLASYMSFIIEKNGDELPSFFSSHIEIIANEAISDM